MPIDLIRAQYPEDGSLDHDEFLALLSHELRTPLGALLAASEVLNAVAPGSADDAEARAVISRQSRRLAQVLHDMLEIGRAMPAVSSNQSASQHARSLLNGGKRTWHMGMP